MLDSDPSGLFFIAQSLMTIQGIFGLIPNIYGKGSAAKHVYELMVRMRREMGGNEPQVIFFKEYLFFFTDKHYFHIDINVKKNL